MATDRSQPRAGTIRVGISGWTYAPWRGTFYPKKLAQKNELAYASAALPSIEINGTFYGLQRPKSFVTWHEQTPEGFVFAVKAPRFITHMRRLRDVQTPMANFLLSGVLRLNEKLGPHPSHPERTRENSKCGHLCGWRTRHRRNLTLAVGSGLARTQCPRFEFSRGRDAGVSCDLMCVVTQ